MTHAPRFALGLALALAATACAGGSPMPADTTADKAAIDALRSRFAATFNAGDPEQMRALYTSDAVLMPEYQPAVMGQAAVVEAWKGMMTMYTPNITITPEETQIAGDWAYDRGTYMQTLTPKNAGAPTVMEHGKYIVILHKEADGSWKIAREIGNSSDPMPTPDSMAKPQTK